LGGQGNSIHAQIYPPAHERFKAMIKEGGLYNFSCFKVKNSHNYKPVANNVMLSFSKWTTIEEVVEVPPGFPMITYSLTPIGNALNSCHSLCQWDPVANLWNFNVQIRCYWNSCYNLKCHDSTGKGGQSERLKRVVTIRSQRSVA
jgi:hypothetical protein